MKTLLTYGTFDLLHIGHVRLLERAKQLGDRLIVGVSTDEFNSQKGKSSTLPFEHRFEMLQSIIHVDEVIPELSWNQKIKDIKRFNVDVFVMGSDWKGKFDFLKQHCQVVYLPRTENISSTEIRAAIAG